MDDYGRYDARGLATLVRDGEVSPTELAAEAQTRLDAAHAAYNLLAHGLDVASALDALPPTGPFRGVPFLLKDQLDVAGQPMTYGSRLLRDWSPAHTHPVAQRFLDAGFVTLGRTTMSELGLLPTTESEAFGPTHNPWRPGFSAGGSSGGAAAAVAAGVVPLAHAADGGGSTRIPASACGLVGLKTSRGREPRWPDDPPQGFVSHFAVTRTVGDAAALLDVLAVDGGLPRAASYAESAERPTGPLRIGLTAAGYWGEPLHPDVHAALTRAAARMEELGHTVEPVAAPVEAEAFAEAFRVLWAAGAGVFFEVARRDAPLPAWLRRLAALPGAFRLITSLAGGTESFTRRLARAQERLSPSDLWLAEQVLDHAAAKLAAFFGPHHLWMTATLSTPPMAHGALALKASDEALKRQLFGYVGFTPVANGTGVPAISIPGGLSMDGLPIGVQLVAPMGREDRLLGVARAFEAAWGWPTRPTDATR
ncbi:MAG: amidase [Myxococcota bacterium]